MAKPLRLLDSRDLPAYLTRAGGMGELYKNDERLGEGGTQTFIENNHTRLFIFWQGLFVPFVRQLVSPRWESNPQPRP